MLTLLLAVRLTFRKSQRTFAEAAAEIDEFFKDTSVSESTGPTTEATSEQSTVPSNNVGKVTDAVTNLGSVEPEQDVKNDDSTMSGTAVASGELHNHHAPPRRGFIPPQIFQAMAESAETSPK